MLSANFFWTGTEMTANRTAKLTIALIACMASSAWAVAATPPPGLEKPESALSPSVDPLADRPAVAITRERAPTGNPLWGIPLRILTATRERPLFSPSRRPPAPAIAAPAPVAPRPVVAAKAPEPDHPLLTIVGTIVSARDSIGVFIDQASNEVIRIHTGQEHGGWVLRSVHGREANFEKNERSSTLALPAPGATPAAGGVPTLAGMGRPVQAPLPVTAPAEAPAPAPAPVPVQAGNTWVDGDGNLIAPPPAKLFQAAGRR
jgi:general secretion pathway protein N